MAAVAAQAGATDPEFVAAESHPMSTTPGAAVKLGQGALRASPVLMETRGHMHVDGSVSTTCAAVQSTTPHSAAVTSRTPSKQQER